MQMPAENYTNSIFCRYHNYIAEYLLRVEEEFWDAQKQQQLAEQATSLRPSTSTPMLRPSAGTPVLRPSAGSPVSQRWNQPGNKRGGTQAQTQTGSKQAATMLGAQDGNGADNGRPATEQPRRITELLYHLHAAGRFDKLAQLLSDFRYVPSCFEFFSFQPQNAHTVKVPCKSQNSRQNLRDIPPPSIIMPIIQL